MATEIDSAVDDSSWTEIREHADEVIAIAKDIAAHAS